MAITFCEVAEKTFLTSSNQNTTSNQSVLLQLQLQFVPHPGRRRTGFDRATDSSSVSSPELRRWSSSQSKGFDQKRHAKTIRNKWACWGCMGCDMIWQWLEQTLKIRPHRWCWGALHYQWRMLAKGCISFGNDNAYIASCGAFGKGAGMGEKIGKTHGFTYHVCLSIYISHHHTMCMTKSMKGKQTPNASSQQAVSIIVVHDGIICISWSQL